MTLSGLISVVIPSKGDVIRLVDIHRSVLGYTLNSQMGGSHLAAMYQSMLEDPDCCVYIALDGQTPVGLVSGSINMEKAKVAILKKFTFMNWMNMLFRFVRNPLLIREWMKGVIIGKPVYYLGEAVDAILTTIAIKEDHQKLGIGEELIHSLEGYFLQRGVSIYRLDTVLSNTGSRAFYKKLGFEEVEQRSDSVVLIKRINTP